MTFISNSESETAALGEKLGAALKSGDVVALYGDLGSGKTAFVRGVARGMGIMARVYSPTFTIVNEYEGKPPLFHFDMYRIGGSDELFDIGWEDYLDSGAVCVVEWSENVEEALSLQNIVKVNFKKLSDTSREINITGREVFAQ
jgi:tRNA threonylcarbamoyladenosine biosynthesis protein TsaE